VRASLKELKKEIAEKERSQLERRDILVSQIQQRLQGRNRRACKCVSHKRKAESHLGSSQNGSVSLLPQIDRREATPTLTAMPNHVSQ